VQRRHPRAVRCSGARLFLILGAFCVGLSVHATRAEAADPAPDQAGGWTVREWKLQTSIYTRHWDPDPAHVNHQKLLGLEAVCANRWLFGAAAFDNSFGQSSQFVYVGRSWPLFDSRFWYVKLMGGLLHGYEKPYEDKIPLNGLGVAPAILPSLGLRYKRVFVETNLAGTAAVTVTAGIAF
jgi:hypothetical protein